MAATKEETTKTTGNAPEVLNALFEGASRVLGAEGLEQETKQLLGQAIFSGVTVTIETRSQVADTD